MLLRALELSSIFAELGKLLCKLLPDRMQLNSSESSDQFIMLSYLLNLVGWSWRDLFSTHFTIFFFFWVAAIWEVPGWWTGMVGYYKICKTGRNYQNEFYGLAWAVTVSKTNCLLVIPLICNIRGMVLFFIYTTPFNWQSISLSGLYECDIFLSYFDLAVSTNIYKVDCVCFAICKVEYVYTYIHTHTIFLLVPWMDSNIS